MRTSKHWRTVASRILLDHPRLTVLEDEVALPSGLHAHWLRFAGEPDSVCIICVDPDRRVLIACQYSHPSGRVVQEFPGGGVQENESCADAARRELMEEVGLFPSSLQEIGAFLTSNRRSSAKQHVFVATELTEQSLPAGPEEEIAYEWVDISTVEERIRSGAIENGTLLAACGRCDAMRAMVIGGGIGELTTALRLHATGIEAHGFTDLDTVISRAELERIAAEYKQIAGFDRDALNRKPVEDHPVSSYAASCEREGFT